MCRFIVYKGSPVFMADLLTRSDHSLIRQSHHARERSEPLNGDGFGVGWYADDEDPIPGVFTSVTPAWSNINLHCLAAKIRSGCFFAHIRAASPGTLVSDVNCHPFQYERYLWMHNGRIAGFNRIKRRMREGLSDKFYNIIHGTSDSEHAFALFLDIMGDTDHQQPPEVLADAMSKTLRKIQQYLQEAGNVDSSYLNFAVTDGKSTVISRHCLPEDESPPTLYITRGEEFQCHDGIYRMLPSDDIKPGLTTIVASEPVTMERAGWEAVPVHHLLILKQNGELDLASLNAG